MKKETQIIFILFFMAFSTLFLLYAAVLGDSSVSEEPVIPTLNDVGKTVYVEGVVLNKRSTFKGGHLIVNIECSDHTVLPIFIPNASGADSISGQVEINDVVGVKGTVEEYNETLELVLKNKDHFKIL
ncbi:MAG: hypothetical protein RBQ94_04605 [Methanimicrococcus sp.]|nr:hypothetical protein [Methanimicrococcus sp.]